MKRILLTALLAGGIFAASQAQTATPQIKQNQVEQKNRISQGKKSGELTPTETARLRAQQKRIQKDKKEAKADGVVTRQERKDIKTKQKRASKNIYHQKHDAQQMPSAR